MVDQGDGPLLARAIGEPVAIDAADRRGRQRHQHAEATGAAQHGEHRGRLTPCLRRRRTLYDVMGMLHLFPNHARTKQVGKTPI